METQFKTLLKEAIQRPVVETIVSGRKVERPVLTLSELLTLDGQLANIIQSERSRIK